MRDDRRKIDTVRRAEEARLIKVKEEEEEPSARKKAKNEAAEKARIQKEIDQSLTSAQTQVSQLIRMITNKESENERMSSNIARNNVTLQQLRARLEEAKRVRDDAMKRQETLEIWLLQA